MHTVTRPIVLEADEAEGAFEHGVLRLRSRTAEQVTPGVPAAPSEA